MPYAVIENTPGYIPDSDDPPIYDCYAEALNDLINERNSLKDCEFAYDDDGNFCLIVSPIVDGYFCYFDKRRIHDLGRVVSIVEVDNEYVS